MKKIILNIITISLVLLTTVGFSAWYIIYQIVLNPEKSIGSISKYYELVQEVVYNEQEQVPTTKQGVQLDFDPATLTYSYKLPYERNYTNGKPVNANVYDVLITATDGRACKIKFTIKPKEVRLDPPLVEINYAHELMYWGNMVDKIKTIVKFVDDKDGTPINVAYNVDDMTNGDITFSNTSNSGLNVYGSTYHVNISLSNPNYKIIGDRFITLKYKTVKVNNVYYTIEDALKTESGDIILCGDASGANTYVVTSFSKLLPNSTYNINGRKIHLPFDNGNTDNYQTTFVTEALLGKDENKHLSNLKDIYAGLKIPSGITLNLNNGTNIVISSILKTGGLVTRRSVVMNDGVINVNAASKIQSYGFLKGTGVINVYQYGEVIDVFRIEDWPGADESLGLVAKNAFPVLNWSVHNISCDTKVFKEGKYNAMTYIVITNGHTTFRINDIFIIGDSNTPNCLFKPFNGSNEDYVLKTTAITNDSWIQTNQDLTYHNQIIVNGKYIDSQMKITPNDKYSFSTSTSIAVPISYYDIILNPGTVLTFSSSSYLLYKNSNILINKNAKLLIEGTAYVFALNNSKITINGTLSGSGTISNVDTTGKYASGSPIDTSNENAIIEGVSFNVPTCIIKIEKEITFNTISGKSNAYTQSGGIVGDLTNGNGYVSMQTNNQHYFVSLKSLNKYFVNTIINGQSNRVEFSSLSNQLTIYTNSISRPSVIHYDFAGWFLDSTYNTPFNEHTFNVSNEEITIYAKMNLKVYSFDYSAGFDNGTNVEPVIPNLANKNPSFTIEDLEKGPIKITTTATYQDKFFDGWYIGVNKTDVPYPFMEFNKVMLENYLNKVGIDNKIIPLYCEFSSNVIYDIYFTTNKVSAEIPKITSDTDTVDLTVQSNELNVDDLNLDYEVYFGGWYCDSEYKTKFINNETKLSALADKDNRVNVYAKWEIKNIVTINHRSIGAKATIKYAKPGQDIDLTTLKYNDTNLHFANAYDASGSKLSNNTQKINSAVTFELEYAVIVNIKHSGKGAVDVKYNGTSLGNSGSHLVIIGSTLHIEIGGYLFNRGVCEISWCNQTPPPFKGKDYGPQDHYCPITYTVPTTQ